MRKNLWILLILGATCLVAVGQPEFRLEVPPHIPRTVWGKQRFLAGVLEIDNTRGAAEHKLTSLVVRNVAGESPLGGAYLAEIEVIRPTDRAVVGEVNSEAYLKNFATPTGVRISVTPEHKTPAFGKTLLEIWITLRESSETSPIPPKSRIQLAVVQINDAHLFRTADSDPFEIGDPEPGLNRLVNVDLGYRELAAFAGARTLVQRVRLEDNDDNPYDVNLKSVHIRNIADPSRILAETYVKKVEIVRASDKKLLGVIDKTANILGLNAGGISVNLGGTGTSAEDLRVRDDDALEIEIYFTLSEDVPTGRRLQLATRVYHTEGGLLFFQWRPEDAAVGPAVVTRAASGLVGEDLTGRDGLIFGKNPFTAQRIRLGYRYPGDPNACILSSILIKNVSIENPVRDEDVLEIRVETEAGTTLGTVTSVKGLRTTGVTLTLSHRVEPEATEILLVKFRLKETVEAGRRLRLETEVKHRSAGLDFTTGWIRSGAEFTTAKNHPPIVDFTFAPSTPRWDETVTFTPNVRDSEFDPPGRDVIVYSRWEFGDGNVVERNGPPETVRYTYNKGGKFTVTLLVRDDKGLEAKKSKEITLSNQAPQGVDFDWTPKAPKWSDTITFTPSRNIRDPDGDISRATFRWSLGDGTTQETRGPQEIRHIYGKGGEFTVTLTVIDAGGAEAAKSYKITVSNLAPTGVDFTISPEAPKWGEPVTFTPARGITDPDGDISKATFAWDFGDGNTTQTTGPQEVRHTYTKGGEYTVTLTVTDQGGASEKKSKKLTVGWPKVDFTWTPAEPKSGEAVTFRATPEPDTHGFGYRWDFGDGTVFPPADKPPATTNLATHTFTLPETVAEKTFTVKLTVTLGETVVGTTENKVKVIRVVNKPPTVTALRMDPAMPKPGEEVTFTATASDPDGDAIVEWQWDLGDGTTRTTTAGILKYRYEKAGAYTAKVRAKDAGSGVYGEWRSLSFYVGTQPIGVNVLDNPASTTCRIQVFTPAGATKVRITILDAAGRVVLSDKDVPGGTFTWDLKDRDGRPVPNGLYLFYVTAEFQGQTIRSEIGRILVVRR